MSGLEAAIEGHSHDDFSLSGHNHDGEYEPVGAVDAAVAALQDEKQDTLISGTNIKTINSTSILGEGNIVIEGGGADIPYQNDAPSNPSDGDLWVDKDAIATGGASLLVAETVVSGSAVTSVTFSGLDGNAAGGYVLECVAGFTGTSVISADINGNKNTSIAIVLAGATNGANATTYIGTTTTGAWVLSNDTTASKMVHGTTIFSPAAFNSVQAYSFYTSGSTNGLPRYQKAIFTDSISNITSITLTSSAANSIVVGSTFRLYKRK